MFRKISYLFLLIILFNIDLYGKPKPENIIVNYSSPTLDIAIINSEIKVTERFYTYDNPISSVPSGTSIKTNSGKIPEEDLKKLSIMIKTNGFLKLKTEYGAPENERFYPYYIKIKIEKKEKTIIYRSNPAFESAPKPFTQIENLLKEISFNRTK